MRQERTNFEPCPGEDVLVRQAAHSGECVHDPGYWLMPDALNGLYSDEARLNLPGGETQYLLTRKHHSHIREETRQLENRAWFDPQTAKLEIMFTLYNPHQDLG